MEQPEKPAAAPQGESSDDFQDSFAKLVELASKGIADKAPPKIEPLEAVASLEKTKKIVIAEAKLEPETWLERRFGAGFKIKLSPLAVLGIACLILCMGSYAVWQVYYIFTKDRVVADSDQGILQVLSETGGTSELKVVSINELARKNRELREKRAAEAAALLAQREQEAASEVAENGVALSETEIALDPSKASHKALSTKSINTDLTKSLPVWIWKTIGLETLDQGKTTPVSGNP